ncbi:NUDIX hydrolase [Gordonia bronchialis DSM 43247]|uniref:NUDIX hydrolase n=1 Tax=Gordonia bronchialis (strain ATCC 25592 / DSM 43247 / BCRC 13721 / JCM 3198 / KCTC 3076 / NBRC 16047 / NCTC 10667) TaxID=526226 RepID=D0L945_GORB4|nr:NUDIX hydrolase [Gordonia bronchialis]ACY22036.1 NUDIX hydrolase [Gordonia bronchialis DSM 43247]MCC3324828.1 NUDIX hydrolase [Gordonia bronchialis]QGS24397.1 NUDIX domain-containing protein [Gordonia bronchialis]STQ64951.1 ADP-ribose pyrophosphatase [Gordonia bronchialis]
MTPAGSHDFAVSERRTVYEGAILALRVDKVQMPGGRVAEREVVEHYGAVAILARDEQGRIAMVRQYRHPIGRRLLELPAGLLDQGDTEDPLTAAQRELAEETDLAADSWRVLVDLDLSPGFTDEALRLYLAEDLRHLDAAERTDEEADMSVEWIAFDEAVAKVLAGEIVNATSVAGILAAAAADRSTTALRSVDAPWPDEPTALRRRRRP